MNNLIIVCRESVYIQYVEICKEFIIGLKCYIYICLYTGRCFQIFFSGHDFSMICWSSKKCFGTSNIGSGGIIIGKFIYFNTKLIQNSSNIQKIMIFEKTFFLNG